MTWRPPLGPYAGRQYQIEHRDSFADADGFLWADKLYLEAPNGTRLVSIDAGDTPMLLDLALDGNGGFPDVIDILGIDATGNSYANLLVGGRQSDIGRGMGGNDRLYGDGGNDYLDGGNGNDLLVGGTGNDRRSAARVATTSTARLAPTFSTSTPWPKLPAT